MTVPPCSDALDLENTAGAKLPELDDFQVRHFVGRPRTKETRLNGYAYKMDFKRIVGEIDAEIVKLQHIRAILQELVTPKSRAVATPRPARVERIPSPEIKPEPRLVILPPRARREYTRRAKPTLVEPKALAAPMSTLPVFVPKTGIPESQKPKSADTEVDLEAAIRRQLLGGAL